MRVFRILLVLFAVSFGGWSAAHADTFTFSFGSDADVFAGSGVLTGTLQSAATATMPAQYLITAVSGTTRTTLEGRDIAIDGIEAPGGFGFNDNLLFFDGTNYSFDLLGLSYSLVNGAEVNLSNFAGQDVEILMRRGGRQLGELTPINIAATPEPGSLLLMGTGLLGGLGVVRRRLAV